MITKIFHGHNVLELYKEMDEWIQNLDTSDVNVTMTYNGNEKMYTIICVAYGYENDVI